MRCPYCGGQISDDSRFCTYCGTKLDFSDVPSKKSGRMPLWGLISLTALVVVVMAAAVIGIGGSDSGAENHSNAATLNEEVSDGEEEMEQLSVSDEETDHVENLMMETEFSYDTTGGPDWTVWRSDVLRSSIHSITFLDSLEDMPDDAWDISLHEDGTVMAWLILSDTSSDGDEMFDLYIGGNGGVSAADCYNLFGMFSNAVSINFNQAFYTDHAVSMYRMFWPCHSIENLDLSGFDTSNVKNMEGLFGNCESLTSLDLSGFDTSNVTNMQQVFYECYALENVNVSGFDTSSVTNMSHMFAGCTSLRELDVSAFNTSNVTGMKAMFYGCLSLTVLDLSGFDTSNVITMQQMFDACDVLEELDVSNFDTSNVTNMSYMFFDCEKLSELDVSGFDITSVVDMRYMFNQCFSLTNNIFAGEDLSGIDTTEMY